VKRRRKHDLYVSCEHALGGKDIRSITIAFGTGQLIKIHEHQGRTGILMAAKDQSITLDASNGSCDLQWAIEILEARLPALRAKYGTYAPENPPQPSG